MTTPSTPGSSPDTSSPMPAAGSSVVSPMVDPEVLASTTAAYEALRKSYQEFSDILSKQGAASALEYAKALAKANQEAMGLADTISGYSEALETNASSAKNNFEAIKREIRSQAEAQANLQAETERLSKLHDNLRRVNETSFDQVSSRLQTAKTDFNNLIEELNNPEGATDRLYLLKEIDNLRLSMKDVKEEEIPQVIEEKRQKFITDFLLRGVSEDEARKRADALTKVVEEELKVIREAKTPEQAAIASSLIEHSVATDRLTSATQRLKDAQDQTPAAKATALFKDALRDANKELSNHIDKLTGASNKLGLFGSAMLAASTGGVGALAKSLSEGLVNSLLSPEKAISRLVNFIDNFLIKSTFKFDETLAGVNKTTGGFRKEFEEISRSFGGNTFANLSIYGVNLEKFGKAYGDLSKTVGGFNNMAADQRKILTENAAVMENLGLSSGEYAKSVTYFMGVLGLNAQQASDSIKRLTNDAIAAGRSVGDYIKDFEQLSPKITGFGKEAQEIFKELNGMMQSTKGKLSAQDFSSFSDQFKDVESATQSIRKLNAALGGTSINFLDVVGKDPAEIAKTIKKAYDISGVEFDKLNIGFKRQLAELFGGDVSKASAYFKMNMADISKQMGDQTDIEKERTRRLQESTSAMEKFKTAVENMKMSLSPIVTVFAKIGETLANVTEKIHPAGVFSIAVIGFIGLVRTSISYLGNKIEGMFASIFARIRAEFGSVRREISETAREAERATAGGGGDAGNRLPETGAATSRLSKLNKVLAWTGAAVTAAGIVKSIYDTSKKEEPESEPESEPSDKAPELVPPRTRPGGSGGALKVTPAGKPILPNISENFTSINNFDSSVQQSKKIIIGDTEWKIKDSDEIFAYDPKSDKIPGSENIEKIISNNSEMFSFLNSSIRNNLVNLQEKITNSNQTIASAFSSTSSSDKQNFTSNRINETKIEQLTQELKSSGMESITNNSVQKMIEYQEKIQKESNEKLLASIKDININVDVGPTVLDKRAQQQLRAEMMKDTINTTDNRPNFKVPYSSIT